MIKFYLNTLNFMRKWVISFQFNMEAVLHINKKFKSPLKADSSFLLPLQDMLTITGMIMRGKDKWMFF